MNFGQLQNNSPLGLYFNSNAKQLLQEYLIQQLIGGNPNAQNYFNNIGGNIGYESSGYGINLGIHNQIGGLGGDTLNWDVNIKIPIDL